MTEEKVSVNRAQPITIRGYPVPRSEAARLAALRALEVLDSPAEKSFDDIVHLAVKMFDVPVALISLVDADRQWFKARLGIEEEEMERSVAFCAHTIMDGTVCLIPDAREDIRFADNPLVAKGFRFYAHYAAHQLDTVRTGTAAGPLEFDFSYDANDNTVTRDAAGTANDWTYAYNAKDEFTQASKAGTTESYHYDAQGRRIAKTTNGTQSSYGGGGFNNADRLILVEPLRAAHSERLRSMRVCVILMRGSGAPIKRHAVTVTSVG